MPENMKQSRTAGFPACTASLKAGKPVAHTCLLQAGRG